jgi:CRP-like cAMP-binding protein
MARKADPVAEALGKVDLFADLSPKELSVVAGLAKPSSFAEGDRIVTEGDTSARFYLLVSGTDVGEIAVLDRGPRTATVVATSAVTTLSLASFSLRPVLKEHPDVLMKLVVKLCERLRLAQDSPLH